MVDATGTLDSLLMRSTTNFCRKCPLFQGKNDWGCSSHYLCAAVAIQVAPNIKSEDCMSTGSKR
eukprot:3631854-Amphidinium_carterae.3